MANSNLTVFPTPVQAPQTVQTPQEITQGDLSYILATRLEVERLKGLLTEAEASVKARLEAGAALESGAHLATLKEYWRKGISWRDVAERLANRLYGNGRGYGYCQNVLSRTKPDQTVSLHVA